jgi:hypothetical protein
MLGFAATTVEGDVKLDAVLDGGDACEEVSLLAIAVDIVSVMLSST